MFRVVVFIFKQNSSYSKIKINIVHLVLDENLNQLKPIKCILF